MKKMIVNGLKTIWTPLNSQRLWQQAKCPPGFKPDGVPVLRSGSRRGRSPRSYLQLASTSKRNVRLLQRISLGLFINQIPGEFLFPGVVGQRKMN